MNDWLDEIQQRASSSYDFHWCKEFAPAPRPDEVYIA